VTCASSPTSPALRCRGFLPLSGGVLLKADPVQVGLIGSRTAAHHPSAACVPHASRLGYPGQAHPEAACSGAQRPAFDAGDCGQVSSLRHAPCRGTKRPCALPLSGQRQHGVAPSAAARQTPQPDTGAASSFLAALEPSGHGGRIAPMVACRSLVRSSLAALIACLAAGVSAGECHFGAPGTTVSIAEHPDAWGEVTIHNRLAYRTRSGPCVLQFDGGEVSVTYDPGPFREPDIFVIEAPEGLRADPDWLLVEDETSVRVLVWPIVEGEGM